MKYRHLFFDLDHTLWDFDANAKATLKSLHEELKLAEKGVHDFDLFHKQYLGHNERLWEKYRNGQIRQEDLRRKRMALSLLDFKIADDHLIDTMSVEFLERLPSRNILFPGTIDVLSWLRDRGYILHMITNGFEKTQHSKLEQSDLSRFFVEVITSEGSNSLKPHRDIFEFALNKSGARKTESIMIGDSIDVDIAGAYDAGIDQVHVNHLTKFAVPIKDNIFPTYTVFDLIELKKIF